MEIEKLIGRIEKQIAELQDKRRAAVIDLTRLHDRREKLEADRRANVFAANAGDEGAAKKVRAARDGLIQITHETEERKILIEELDGKIRALEAKRQEAENKMGMIEAENLVQAKLETATEIQAAVDHLAELLAKDHQQTRQFYDATKKHFIGDPAKAYNRLSDTAMLYHYFGYKLGPLMPGQFVTVPALNTKFKRGLSFMQIQEEVLDSLIKRPAKAKVAS